jgi:hypothetical protein
MGSEKGIPISMISTPLFIKFSMIFSEEFIFGSPATE